MELDRSMNSRWAWLAVFLSVAWVFSVQAADEWKTYRYPQDGFAIEFPGVPAPQEQKLDPKRLLRDSQYWFEKGDVAYGIGASLFHHNIIAGRTPDMQIAAVIEGVRGSLKCTIRSQRPLSFPGATARELIMEKCQTTSGGVARQRVLIAGDWLYQVMVLGSKPGTEDSDDNKRFLDSFSLTAR
jgi:hypothetical protein